MKTNKSLLLIILLVSLFTTSVFADLSGEVISISLLNQDPDPAISGDTFELRFSVENLGDYSKDNYVLELLPTYPFEAVPGEELINKVGRIDPNMAGDNRLIVKFKVKINNDITAGSYDLSVLAYEEGHRDVDVKYKFNIDVGSKDSAEVIYIDQVELLPGKITPMKFTINNVGSTLLRDLSFKWENEDDIILPVGSDNTKYIKYIDVKDSVELEFDVMASSNADPDLYKLDLTLNYDDPVTGTQKSIETKAGVYVGGATDFDVAFSGTSQSEYTFSISNIGSVSASSVTVNIPDQEGWKVTGSSSVIIGNLNQGDYTIASYTIRQTGTTTRDNNIPGKSLMDDAIIKLKIDYTDSRGNRNSVIKQVSIDPSALQSTDETTFVPGSKRGQMTKPDESFWQKYDLWIIGGIIVALVIIIQKKYGKGKRKNSNYTYKQTIKDLIKRKK
jgi:hypothetical protein